MRQFVDDVSHWKRKHTQYTLCGLRTSKAMMMGGTYQTMWTAKGVATCLWCAARLEDEP